MIKQNNMNKKKKELKLILSFNFLNVVRNYYEFSCICTKFKVKTEEKKAKIKINNVEI